MKNIDAKSIEKAFKLFESGEIDSFEIGTTKRTLREVLTRSVARLLIYFRSRACEAASSTKEPFLDVGDQGHGEIEE